MRLLCITASVGRSRSVKNAADTTAFFKAHLYSNAQKALQKSGFKLLTSCGILNGIMLRSKARKRRICSKLPFGPDIMGLNIIVIDFHERVLNFLS